MMVRSALVTATLVCALSGAPAQAQDMKSMNLATELGSVLAAEEFCGLSYDQAAIAAWIEKRIKADDMGFPSTLNMMTMGAEAQQKRMNASRKTAHCAQIVRIAKSFGFVK
jgi:DhnA family fructose-bisphosphate aldolase class Ia